MSSPINWLTKFLAVISKTAYVLLGYKFPKFTYEINCSQPQWLALNAQQESFFSLFFLATNRSTIEKNFYCDNKNYRKRTRRKLSTSELFIHPFYDPSDGLQYLSTSSYKPKIYMEILWQWSRWSTSDWIKVFMPCIGFTQTDSSVQYISLCGTFQRHQQAATRAQTAGFRYLWVWKRSVSSRQWAKATNIIKSVNWVEGNTSTVYA